MSEFWYYAGPLLAGALIGLVFFESLWLTIRRLPHVRRPGLAVLASFGLRMLFLAAALYWVIDGDWRRAPLAVVGLLLVRALLVRLHSVAQPTGAPMR